MIERADQLVLEYVSRAADAAHGVLRQDQRLAFVRRLRERIDAERRGMESPAAVARLLSGFGDPVALVEREARRLAEEAARAGQEADPAGGPGRAGARGGRSVPPGAAHSREEALRWLARHEPGARPVRRPVLGWSQGLRRVPVPGRSAPAPDTTGPGREGPARRGTDAASLLAARRREAAGVALLVLAGLLVPLAPVQVGVVPLFLLVWAAGALAVLAAPGWEKRDRVLGAAAPVLACTVGGALVALVRSEGRVGRLAAEFSGVSGLMFVLGTVAGVSWLARRLLGPPPPATGGTSVRSPGRSG
ncbi:hypothetical protein ACFOWE_18480 [Planomonospora corallina]|uniref:Integral membrane protein n=1 Tax=Planomonospora corallina TaxID=1806052 RepID=A0ABV8IBI3_9ACTN